MSTEKTTAIVLRMVEFSESSCVVTLFTRDFGKIGALAKGARRPKSPFDSALDLLALCRIVFIHKSSDALDLLTEAKLERRFRAAGRDLSRLYAGYYVVELLQELTDYGDPHPELFALARRTLADLDGDAHVAESVVRFEVGLLRLLGFMPSLDACVSCGCELQDQERALFGQIAGGVLCRECRVGQRQVVSLAGDVITALRSLIALEDHEQTPEIDSRTRGPLRGLLNHFFSNLVGRPPRMHSYLGALR